MQYLTDKIYVSYTPTAGQYTNYTVTCQQYSGGSEVVFNGRVYGMGSGSQKIYLNDIAESCANIRQRLAPSDNGGIPSTFTQKGVLQKFTVAFEGGGSYSTDWVLSYYKDPNQPDGSRSIPSNPLLERSSVLPRIPHLVTAHNMFFAYDIIGGSSSLVSGGSFNSLSASGMVGGTKVADVDECPADFYCIWMDRTSGIQCQPFAGKKTYSESISTTYRTDAFNSQVPYTKSFTGQWNLNTEWLNDEQYRAYSSITTSPYIWVYDTKRDFISCCNGADNSWTEKTWKNQKKLFSLNISVHTAPTNITY